jgi:two-component system response regulator AtoC
MVGPVLVLESDPGLQRRLAAFLDEGGWESILTTTVEEAVAALATTRVAMSFVGTALDLAPPGAALTHLRRQGGDPGPIVVLGNPDDPGVSGEQAADGTEDRLSTAFQREDLERMIREVLARPRKRAWTSQDGDTTERLRREVALWRSAQMQAVWHVVQQAAEVDVTVLICGETGTGKEVVARAIHHLSTRQREPFIKVNCAAVPPDLLESELFGHERGAFTGAHQLKLGKFEAANQGTIFLDEIGELHPTLQAKLLHVLQDGAFSRVGGKSTINVDVRILAATNRDLERAVVEHRFRDDLYYRINVIQIVVPPLRDRREEIPGLTEYFAERYARAFHREGFQVAPSAIERLTRYRFPGNVRELENLVKRMIVLGDPLLARIPFGHGGEAAGAPGSPTADVGGRPVARMTTLAALPLKEVARQAARAAEREAISRVLDETGWNRVRAAKLLKISYRALLYKIKDAGLEQVRPAWRPAT